MKHIHINIIKLSGTSDLFEYDIPIIDEGYRQLNKRYEP